MVLTVYRMNESEGKELLIKGEDEMGVKREERK